MRNESKNLPINSLNRREFLRLMGASLALTGLAGCNLQQPVEEIVPYVRQPENLVLGKPMYYATAATLGGFAQGLLVESREFRPTKVEGNPLHPASLGASDIFAQASVLSLYDPDRAKDVLQNGQISTWDTFLTDMRRNLAKQKSVNGAGLRILTETITSPTLASQIKGILQNYPNAVWHQYEPVNRDNELAGAIEAFGEPVETIYKFDQAEIVVSLDADFLFDAPGSVRYARDFSKIRRVRNGNARMNRFYAVEGSPTVTGSLADHRLPLKSSEIENFSRILAAKFGAANDLPNDAPVARGTQNFINALAKDLNENRGKSVVAAGRNQPPFVHFVAHSLNSQLGNVGKTVFYTAPIVVNPIPQIESLRGLVNEMNAGKVEMLVIIGGNPVYNSPSDFNFAQALDKVAWRTHLSLYEDETSALCQWQIPQTHELEMWSDARAYDGTATIIQPLIAPLYNGKSAHELLTAFTDNYNQTGYETVRQFWSSGNITSAFEQNWQKSLRDGVIENTVFTPKQVTLKIDLVQSPESRVQSPNTIEINFRPDPSVYDGRFSNNGWLQELPKPLTKLTWDNAALMSPATAKNLGINNEEASVGGSHGQTTADVVELNFGGETLRIPAFIVAGHADDAVTVSLGYGRTNAGQIGNGAGFNAYLLRNSGAMWFGGDLQINKTGDTFSLACTQNHHSMEGRDLVRVASLDEFTKNPRFAKREADDPDKQISLYPGWKYEGHAWGMSIDTSICNGCNACVVACQAENNIPVVGKEEVLRAREMHWIRVDTYYETDEAGNAQTLHQPVPCMHCENAPCEVVCPPGATVHSSEGLNDMVYNRCVGTRYCSNNCPYKVRRFNFFGYADFDTPVVQLQRNPEVTIRSRGVMEKCTYCVQRIQIAKINAETEGRDLREGEITTACQQACPTEAIIFGDINDPNSRVSKLKSEPTNYGLLADLNTRPRTTYLATVKNPNAEIEKG
ncbi:MAG: 4Fe-4S dicluster domain-containing protein [Acidobacteriota bacterium]|nr:4Fe-4S dicluster domain-containing protein [Acidobacteriota bacterium]